MPIPTDSTMNSYVSELYGEPHTIRYLIASIDDICEVTETVRFMLAQYCKKDDLQIVMKSIPIMAVPLPHTLSSFILGIGVPSKILKQTVPGTSKVTAIENLEKLDSKSDPEQTAQNDIQTTIKVFDDYSEIELELQYLDDLAIAARNIVQLLKSNSERFAYINLKRKLHLKATPSENESHGFRLTIRVPQVLQTV